VRRFALAAVVTLGGFGVAAACADPYEGEIPTSAPDRDGSVGADVVAPAEASTDAGADDAADAIVVDPCSDRDKDGFLAKGCDGGLDCDDDDNRAHPDSGFRTDTPTTTTKGDWNCDGKYTLQYQAGVKCSDHSSLVGGGCAIEGFLGTPACGASGDYVKCKSPAVAGTCLQDTVETKVQGCQ
jgi:hypothetical protein